MGVLLPSGFVALAVYLGLTSGRPRIPIDPPVQVDPAALVVGPRRVAMADPPHTLVGGVPENCNACHQVFSSSSPGGAAPTFHTDIRLNHGLNDRCVNCHDAGDRERLTLRDGETIGFAQTPLLCAQCHGTTYRDWERGTHGKTLGSWITGSEAQRRLTCNECHNPHSPRYDPYVPLPGPRTLRMDQGAPGEGTHQPEGAGPLQQWLREREEAEGAQLHRAPEDHP